MKQIGRRRFIKAVPVAVAATVAVPAFAQRGGGAPPKFGKDVLKCAEQIDGLHFTDAEDGLDELEGFDWQSKTQRLSGDAPTRPVRTLRSQEPGTAQPEHC